MALAELYERIDKLGEGTYGIVYKARDKRTHDIVALKRMVPTNEAEGIPGTTMREIAFLRHLKHAHIVWLRDVHFNVPKLTLVFECCDMDLAKHLRSKPQRKLEGPEIKSFMLQFLHGLAYMHSHNIMHRDLKPHNLLLCDNATTLKIADFGLARIHGIPVKKYRHDAVTLWYRPPDLLLGSIMYEFAMDIWSAGCIFAEMISGAVLFQGKTEVDQLMSMFSMFGFPQHTQPAASSPQRAQVGEDAVGEFAASNEQTPAPPLIAIPQPPAEPVVRDPSPRGRSGPSPFQHQDPPCFPTFDAGDATPVELGFKEHGSAAAEGDSRETDVFPSFAAYPNVKIVMEKGLADRIAQCKLARAAASESPAAADASPSPPAASPGCTFDEWVEKHNAVEKVGREGVDLLRRMLQLEPSRRITALEAVEHPYFSSLAPRRLSQSDALSSAAWASTIKDMSFRDVPNRNLFPSDIKILEAATPAEAASRVVVDNTSSAPAPLSPEHFFHLRQQLKPISLAFEMLWAEAVTDDASGTGTASAEFGTLTSNDGADSIGHMNFPSTTSTLQHSLHPGASITGASVSSGEVHTSTASRFGGRHKIPIPPGRLHSRHGSSQDMAHDDDGSQHPSAQSVADNFTSSFTPTAGWGRSTTSAEPFGRSSSSQPSSGGPHLASAAGFTALHRLSSSWGPSAEATQNGENARPFRRCNSGSTATSSDQSGVLQGTPNMHPTGIAFGAEDGSSVLLPASAVPSGEPPAAPSALHNGGFSYPVDSCYQVTSASSSGLHQQNSAALQSPTSRSPQLDLHKTSPSHLTSMNGFMSASQFNDVADAAAPAKGFSTAPNATIPGTLRGAASDRPSPQGREGRNVRTGTMVTSVDLDQE